MRILCINPNTTVSMTEKIGQAARAVAAAGTEIVAVNPEDGPVSVEGSYDEAISVPFMLEEVQRGEAGGTDGYVIACADDPGLDAARELATGPVAGIGEAAMHHAAFLGAGFSLVTTLSRSVPVFRHNAQRYGLVSLLRSVRAAEVPVLALEDESSGARLLVRDEVERAIREDGAECIVLGCAGMADLARWLMAETGVPVIDGVAAAVKTVEGLVAQQLGTSKIGFYAPPRQKPYLGIMAGHGRYAAQPGKTGSSK